jgi:diphthamide biosynthesis enzyme Dph1/Dph2-like protein
MKTLFIEAKSRSKVNSRKILEISKVLPKNIAITYSIQFKNIAQNIKKILLKNHKITCFIQVLGCSRPKFPKNTNAILLIGSGRFHGISLAYGTNLPIYILNRNNLSKITKEEVEKLQKKQKAAYLRFLNSNEVGILVSTKPGQNRLKKALEFKKQLKKKSYLFLSNNINTNEFENFPINSYINTACPQLELDTSFIININKIKP